MARIKMCDRRVALVDAGLRVMNRGGVAAATTRAVVAEADMSLASFHYAFTSRDELILETMRRLVGDYAEGDSASDGPATDPLGALTAELNRQMDQRLASAGRSAVVLELTAIALREPGLERVAMELTEARRTMHTRLVQHWARRRGLRWRIEPDQIGSVVMAALDGLVIQWLADRDTPAAHDGVALLSESIMALAEPLVSTGQLTPI